MKKQKFAKRLSRYSSFALAVAGVSEADGQVIYTDVNPDFSGGLGSSYAIDLNNDGVDDVIIDNRTGFSIYPFLYANPQGTNGLLGSGSSAGFAYPYALNSGDNISSGAGNFLNGSANSMNFSNYYGNWIGVVTDKYLGLQFDISGNTHYGWIRLDVAAGSTYVVKDFAYESTPGVGIDAGEMPVSGPEYTYSGGVWSPSDPSGLATAADDILIVNGTVTLTADTEVNSITINPGAVLNIQGALKINGDIINNGSLVFISDGINLGQLDQTEAHISGSGAVSVQRHIPARNDSKAAYRYIASAVNSTGSINANWQEGAATINDNPNPGFGMFITGSTTGANGFDATPAGAPSMFTFDEANQTYDSDINDTDIDGIPNTDTDQLVAGVPYVAYVWGDRSVNIINNGDPVATTTTLQALGSLVPKTQSATGSSVAGEFNLFGNPYQAIVNVNDVLANSVNLGTSFYYVWDPNLGTRGAYATVDLTTGTPSPSTSQANQYLQPGQAAFFSTLANGTSTILFEQTDKDVAQTPTDVFKTQNTASIELQLFQTDRFAKGQSLSDALRVNFSQGESNAVLPNDALKLPNWDENLALVNGIEHLAIENRALPTDGEVLQLHNDQYRVSDYVYKAIVNELPNDISAFLKDAYLGTKTKLNNNGETLVNFSVDETASASMAPDRFSIVFGKKLSLDENPVAGFAVYPNPVKGGSFFIVFDETGEEKAHVSVFDLLGRKVLETEKAFGPDKRMEIEVANLNAGAYMVKVVQNGKSFVQKLIVEQNFK